MPTGISGLYKNTKGARMAQGERLTNYERIKNMSVEEMADIQGYEGLYKIDRNGNVYSLYKNRI